MIRQFGGGEYIFYTILFVPCDLVYCIFTEIFTNFTKYYYLLDINNLHIIYLSTFYNRELES